ncbi:PGPGW domain-containing protein [Actinomadura fulvescens]|uniref:PGPGW domain-containing protein n=1 Tax=Actinomadura fulvescens TaxID=46160 RepID=UPI0031D88285
MVGVAGTALIAAGIAMLVLPGPGILAIFAGLALLATEFETAKRVNDWARARFHDQWQKVRGRVGRDRQGKTSDTAESAESVKTARD